MYKKFRDYCQLREGQTIRPQQPGMMNQGPQNQADQQVDQEIANNPSLLMPKNGNPQAVKPIVDKAIQNKKMNNRVSMDAALKAAQMSQQRLQQNAGQ